MHFILKQPTLTLDHNMAHDMAQDYVLGGRKVGATLSYAQELILTLSSDVTPNNAWGNHLQCWELTLG